MAKVNKITDASEDAGEEYLFVAGGSANLYSLYRKQCGGFSKR